MANELFYYKVNISAEAGDHHGQSNHNFPERDEGG